MPFQSSNQTSVIISCRGNMICSYRGSFGGGGQLSFIHSTCKSFISTCNCMTDRLTVLVIHVDVVHADGVRICIWTAATNGRPTIPKIIYEYEELRWNDTDRADTRTHRRNLPQCHFIHHKPPHALARA
jgi:hypothetical protein